MTHELDPDIVTPNPTPLSPLLDPDAYLMSPDEVFVPDLPSGCDDGGPIQSYLYFNGAEIANGSRTLSYMRSGDVFGACYPKFHVSDGTPCWVQAEDAGGGPFVSPVADPAPWYDAAAPASGEFLGLLIEPDSQKAFFDSFQTRTVTPRLGGLGGAQIGPARVQARSWVVKGYLIASSCEGMEYGRRWLENTLDGLGCDPCSLYSMQMRDACPPCSDPTRINEGMWLVYEAALTQGPAYQDPTDDCCCAQEVEFTITAGNGYLYSAITDCAAGFSPVADFFTTPIAEDLVYAASFDKKVATDVLSRGAAGGASDATAGTISIEGQGARHGFGCRIHKTVAPGACYYGPRATGLSPGGWPTAVRNLMGSYHLNIHTLPATRSEILQVQTSGANAMCMVVNSDGTLQLGTSDVTGVFAHLSGTFPSPGLALDTDYHIEFYIDTSQNPWTLLMLVNGVTWANAHLAFVATAADITGIVWGSFWTGSVGTYDLTIDDAIILKATTTPQFPGDYRVEHVEANADVQLGNFSVTGAANAWSALNSIDDVTSYVSATVSGTGTTGDLIVGMQDIGVLGPGEEVVGAFLNGRVGGTQTTQTARITPHGFNSAITLQAGQDAPGGQWDCQLNGWTWGTAPTAGGGYGAVLITPPGGGAWTQTSINDLVIGLLPAVSGAVPARCSYLGMEVAVFLGVETCAPFSTWYCTVAGELCCAVAPPLVGVVGAIITIASGSGVSNLGVATYDSCDPATRTLIDSMTVSGMPAGTFLEINSATRTITYTDAAGNSSDGTPLIRIPDGEGFPWLELADCDAARCVCCDFGAFCTLDGTQEVTIQTQQRVA